jgi:DNA-binding SARP family transcriptional activator
MDKPVLSLFGTPRLTYAGQPILIERRKALALAAYLALTEREHSRDALAALFWPDLDQERARTSLRATLPALTRALPVTWLEAGRSTVRLLPENIDVDVLHFLALLKRLQVRAASSVDMHQALQQAVTLYQSDFMDGFSLPDCAEFEQWLVIQREWLGWEFGGALRRLAQLESDSGNSAAALRHAQRWLARDPLHEPAHRLLMQLYAAHGQRADALRQYQQCAEILNAELLTPPEDETTDLYQRILNAGSARKPGSALAQAEFAGVLPPLPSLIVGRTAALDEIRRRLGAARPITVLQGWPGVGKSTTVAALAHDALTNQQFPDGVLWTSLGETPNLLVSLSAWADAYRLIDSERPARLEELSSLLTAVLRDKRVLLIVDDVWRAEDVLPFRVGGQGCALLLTTRLNDIATTLAPTATDIYRLPVLADAAALELLGKLTPETVSSQPEAALALVRDLEGLPLAINVAGRLLHNEARLGWGIDKLLDELRGTSLLQAQAPNDMTASGRDASPTVAALLRRSTDALEVPTRERFALLSLFAPKPATFDLQAISVAWNIDDPRPTLRTLMNRGLIEPISGGRFQMHALLVLHARALLEELMASS